MSKCLGEGAPLETPLVDRQSEGHRHNLRNKNKIPKN